MGKLRTRDDIYYQRVMDGLDKIKYRCKCDHRVVIPRHIDRNICDWCGSYVFKNKKDEFEYRLKEKLNKI